MKDHCSTLLCFESGCTEHDFTRAKVNVPGQSTSDIECGPHSSSIESNTNRAVK